jgi:hypothetical protein
MSDERTVRVIGPRDPHDPEAINTTSTSPTWSRGLSPFYLGPVDLYDGYVAQTMENAWQYAKLYEEHACYDGPRVRPAASYWRWALHGWTQERAVRYPMGKGAVPVCSWWDGQALDYISARKRIYLPLYRDAVRTTAAFKRLQQLYAQHGRVTLWDFDGYDHLRLGLSLRAVLNNPQRKMGHAFVLAMLLIYGPRFHRSDLR